MFSWRNMLYAAGHFQSVLPLAEVIEHCFKDVTRCVDMMHRVPNGFGDAYASSKQQMDKVASRKSVYDRISWVCFPIITVSDVC
jgi:hypothetical protein